VSAVRERGDTGQLSGPFGFWECAFALALSASFFQITDLTMKTKLAALTQHNLHMEDRIKIH